ncbi:DUF7097 family protein [Haloglomus halophilum]|uniref:DUF7097 family protein n=1 Tax=Haloglomus halophilum TaxID=2962672 RepID=UPI0020C93BC3|nr:hypothetical protein [Haloglomus halophilum]
MKTPSGTSVGVDDPYEHVERCDHLTDDGRCRYAAEHGQHDPEFAAERRADDLRCPAADPEGAWDWADCPHFRARQRSRECVRCGLEEVRLANAEARDTRPLLEEHHLSYREGDRREPSSKRAERSEATSREHEPEADMAHEITVYLCRWCHAKVHGSWARVDDDAAPDPEAIAAKEERRTKEQAETGFETAAERFDPGDTDDSG